MKRPAFLRSKVPALLVGAVLSFVLTQGVVGQSLQAQNKGDSVNWIVSNVMGWAELDYIPMRVYFSAGSAGSHKVTIDFPHVSGKVFGFEDLSGFTAFTPNLTFTTLPELVTDRSGNWSYVFTVSISDDKPAEVRLFARLAAGAHLYGGSSLQLKGSAGNVAFHKPVAAPGAPDLAVTLTGPASASWGVPATFTLSYTNKVPSYPALGSQLTVILAPELTLDVASLGTNAHVVGNTIFWDLGDVSTASGQIAFQASISPLSPLGSVLTNAAQIYSSQNDLAMQDNSVVLLTSVICGGTATTFSANPASVSVCPGETATFSVSVTGATQMTYQWRKDGTPIAGATDANLTIPAVSSTDVGSYQVVVTTPCDAVTSSSAALSLRLGMPLNLTAGHFEPDGAFVISFGTACGGTYLVEYSENLVTWKTSPQTAPGNGLAVQWRDAGQPATDSMPGGGKPRFYRVVRVL